MNGSKSILLYNRLTRRRHELILYKFNATICIIETAQYIVRTSLDALWSPAWKGLTSWLSFVMSYCLFVTFPCGILGQVWYLLVSIPDLCPLSYFVRVFRLHLKTDQLNTCITLGLLNNLFCCLNITPLSFNMCSNDLTSITFDSIYVVDDFI